MLITISREKENISFVVIAKEFIGLQDHSLSSISSIIIYKTDDSIGFGAVKLNPVPKWAKIRGQPGGDVNTRDKTKRTVV